VYPDLLHLQPRRYGTWTYSQALRHPAPTAFHRCSSWHPWLGGHQIGTSPYYLQWPTLLKYMHSALVPAVKWHSREPRRIGNGTGGSPLSGIFARVNGTWILPSGEIFLRSLDCRDSRKKFRCIATQSNKLAGFLLRRRTKVGEVLSNPRFGLLCEEQCYGPSAALFGDMQVLPDLVRCWL
jgi:hypothetical protein